MAIDYDAGRALLEEIFTEVASDILSSTAPPISEGLLQPFDTIFTSATQAYREGLVGCAIARFQDRKINIRLPYKKQGADAYNGRTLDEKVVNPFLQEHRIPCSGGPFLSAFRRGIQFEQATERGLKDIEGYRAFLQLVGYLEQTTSEAALRKFVRYLLYKFAKLREQAEVPLTRLQRMSLEQYGTLIGLLLGTPSGGRLPVIIVVAAFRTIKDFFGTEWTIEFQGINVADSPSGAGGDVTVIEAGQTVLAAEITERPMDRSRVVTTFNAKIAPHGIGDYLFFVSLKTLSPEARQQARQYFAQGNEVNFLEIRAWVTALLSTIGKRGRDMFNIHLLALMDASEMPRQLKVAWNDYIAAIISGNLSLDSN
jgi:hypothetical protein